MRLYIQRGFAISQQHRQHNNAQTGHLDRRTVLHKRYEIIRTVGQGGMGAVYQARDTKRQMVCAIKEMSLSMVPEGERLQAIQNFKAEAKMLWGLNHPNLPSFYGLFNEDQRYFMVMEFIEGYTLEELLERNSAPFAERRVLGWARQLCDVLEYLHSQKPPIIFRDMKPGNIMLTRNGRIKLIDFGIARFFRPSSGPDTQLLGTPGFAPPEQYGKAQTDERSDIYSLAITLFQLLTNTLSETGFGLKDVRAVNAQISPGVARALEKAASLVPEDRYDNVAAFRRALLGVGLFVFENGDQATTPEELADLCSRYPEEAGDYLADGEVESWLREIGENDLAREARQLRISTDDPLSAVEQFIQTVMGPNARLRGHSGTSIAAGKTGSNAGGATVQSVRKVPNWLARKPVSPVQILPRTIDFGAVYPGISAPLSFTIAGRQGAIASGTIHAAEPWLMVDQSQFDGMSTRVNVRVNSTRLPGGRHYSGTILVVPDTDEDERDEKELAVIVEVDVTGTATSSTPQRRGGKTFGIDQDDDDEDYDALTMGGMTMAPPTLKAKTPTSATQTASTYRTSMRDAEYKIKYGPPGSSGWEPLRIQSGLRIWFERARMFSAAFMLSSLWYILIDQLQVLRHTSPLPPNAWFILVLCGIVPTSALGTLLVARDASWSWRELINRACTSMGSALVVLALAKLLWQATFGGSFPSMQFLLLLLVTAIGAVVGAHPVISDRILQGASWAMQHMRILVIALAVLIGGGLGYALTANVILGCFTPLGILLGIGVAVALVLRVDHLLKQRRQKYP